MSHLDLPMLYEAHQQELANLLEAIVAGELLSHDRVEVERRVVRLIEAVSRLQELHGIDDHGRCGICWADRRTRWLRRERTVCTVLTALGFYLGNPEATAVHSGQNWETR